MLYMEALGMAKASCLAAVCGHLRDMLWPVVWIGDWCHIFHPPECGTVSAEYFARDAVHVDSVSHERGTGIRLIWEDWDKFVHIGEVPTVAERASTHPGSLGAQLPCYTPPYNHGDDDDERSVSAMPCNHAKDGNKPVGVKRWLMDSGTPLDLIDESEVE